jgi:hypothetical protein
MGKGSEQQWNDYGNLSIIVPLIPMLVIEEDSQESIRFLTRILATGLTLSQMLNCAGLFVRGQNNGQCTSNIWGPGINGTVMEIFR